MYISLSRDKSRGASVLAALVIVAVLGVVAAGLSYFRSASLGSSTSQQSLVAAAGATPPAGADTQQCNKGEVHLVTMTKGSKPHAEDKNVKCFIEQTAANGTKQMVKNPKLTGDDVKTCEAGQAEACVVKYCTGANITGTQDQCKVITCQGSTTSCLSETLKSTNAAAAAAQSIVGAQNTQGAAQAVQNFQQQGYVNGNDILKDALANQQDQTSQALAGTPNMATGGAVSSDTQSLLDQQSNIQAANQQLALNSGTNSDVTDPLAPTCPDGPTGGCAAVADNQTQADVLRQNGYTCTPDGSTGSFECTKEPTASTTTPPPSADPNCPNGQQGACGAAVSTKAEADALTAKGYSCIPESGGYSCNRDPQRSPTQSQTTIPPTQQPCTSNCPPGNTNNGNNGNNGNGNNGNNGNGGNGNNGSGGAGLGSGLGGGSGSGLMSGLGSLLGGLAKGMGLTGSGTPAAGNTVPQAPGTCNTQYMCSGSTLYYRNNQCVDQPMQYCQYGCNGTNTCATQQQNQYGIGTDGQPCTQPPTQPPASTCTTGTWKSVSVTNNGCTTGWQCVPSGTGAPTAQLSCQPQTVDVGMSVAFSFACGNSTSSTGGGFYTGGALSGATTTLISHLPSGTNTATFTLGCIYTPTNGTQLTTSAQCSVNVNNPTIVLVANPSSVTSGASSAIGWVTTGMQSCVISSPTLPDFTLANASSTSVNGVATTTALTASTTVFALNCQTLGGGTKMATTSVTTYVATL